MRKSPQRSNPFGMFGYEAAGRQSPVSPTVTWLALYGKNTNTSAVFFIGCVRWQCGQEYSQFS